MYVYLYVYVSVFASASVALAVRVRARICVCVCGHQNEEAWHCRFFRQQVGCSVRVRFDGSGDILKSIARMP